MNTNLKELIAQRAIEAANTDSNTAMCLLTELVTRYWHEELKDTPATAISATEFCKIMSVDRGIVVSYQEIDPAQHSGSETWETYNTVSHVAAVSRAAAELADCILD